MSSNDILFRQIADVAELADAHDSGSCEITLIGVQVPSSALYIILKIRSLQTSFYVV